MSLPAHGRVLFTATLVRGHIAKFHVPYLRWFKERGWETWVAARNDYPGGACEIPCCDRFVNVDFARSPFSGQTLVAYRQLRELFASERFDLVHTHTPVGSVLTRLAARDARRAGTRVVYTAHGFHFYDGAPLRNWALWYPVERLMSRHTDVLVTINREDYGRARRFARCRVEYVPGVGVDLGKFKAQPGVREAKRRELGFADGDFVLLSVGDLTRNKNAAAVIDALPRLPEGVRHVVAGDGPLAGRLGARARRRGVESRVSLLGFRRDVPELLAACDAFCLPSRREGMPVSLIEAMAAGRPCVASAIRGVAPDLLEDHASGLLLDEPDAAHIAAAVTELMGDPALSARLAKAARDVSAHFGLETVVGAMGTIYESMWQTEMRECRDA